MRITYSALKVLTILKSTNRIFRVSKKAKMLVTRQSIRDRIFLEACVCDPLWGLCILCDPKFAGRFGGTPGAPCELRGAAAVLRVQALCCLRAAGPEIRVRLPQLW